jgi:hypothetical protein
LETVPVVLELAGQPMRTSEIHAAAEALLRKPVLRPRVKAALSAGAIGEKPHFRRLSRGVY